MWTGQKTAQNPFWLWGYIQNSDGSAAPYPRLRILTPDGKAYGDVYVGDGGGVYNVAIPSSDYIIEVMTNGNKTWRGPAYMLVGATTRMAQGSISETVQPPSPLSPGSGGDVDVQITTGGDAGGQNKTIMYLAIGAGLFFLGRSQRWF
jgi:hypothetical protein